MTDLHQASTMAQQHVDKERRQACGYNKQVKGTRLNVGDRVLLANKGEKGKKKLSGMLPYTLSQIGNQKPTSTEYPQIVHMNLLLDMSFLLVQSVAGDGSKENELDDSSQSVFDDSLCINTD